MHITGKCSMITATCIWIKTTWGDVVQLSYVGKTLRPLRACSLHSHDTWELVYNEKGTGVIELDGEVQPFSEGSVFLYSPGVRHRKKSEDVFEDYFVNFSGLGLAPGAYSFSDTEDRKLYMLLRLLYLCYCDSAGERVCDNLLSALGGLIDGLLTRDTVADRNAQQLRRLIVDRFSDTEFRIQDAIEEIPLHGDYLRRCFKAAYGMTPHAYLMQLRMENAKKLLASVQEGALSVADAAYMSGFYDPLYFSRAFKKYTGVAPSAWKGSQ